MERVHFIGIGGTGLSAIALLLREKGVEVSGSDRHMSPLARRVQAAGAQVFAGHRAENVHGASLVVRSSAIGDDNVEVQAARELGIPVLKRSEFLGQLMAEHYGIAVAGSHGKTTTTAMIAWMLTSLQMDPSYIIGGVATNLGKNAHAGRGPHFVIEADEYDRMFLGLQPQIAVVTNIEYDHPDYYPTPDAFYQAFVDFADRVPADGTLLVCGDDPGGARLLNQMTARGKRALAYGLEEGDHYTFSARNLTRNANGGFSFQVICRSNLASGGRRYTIFHQSLLVPGVHNVRNALAALAVIHQLGIDIQHASQALAQFEGTGRRFEVRGQARGVTVIDDYAHHPAEIRATLAAARTRFPGQTIWTVWQPHTYSRTRALYREFCASFEDADRVLVTEVFPAREAPPEDGFSAAQIAADIRGPKEVLFTSQLTQARDYLLANLQAGDVVIVLSAGDADQISMQVLDRLEKLPARPVDSGKRA